MRNDIHKPITHCQRPLAAIEMTLDELLITQIVKGHFIEFLGSIIIGYLSFFGFDDAFF